MEAARASSYLPWRKKLANHTLGLLLSTSSTFTQAPMWPTFITFSTVLLFWQGIDGEVPSHWFSPWWQMTTIPSSNMRLPSRQLLGENVQVFELINARSRNIPSPVCNPLLLAGRVLKQNALLPKGVPYKGHDLQQYYQLVADLGVSDGESGIRVHRIL